MRVVSVAGEHRGDGIDPLRLADRDEADAHVEHPSHLLVGHRPTLGENIEDGGTLPAPLVDQRIDVIGKHPHEIAGQAASGDVRASTAAFA